jgi:hypothetical protein
MARMMVQQIFCRAVATFRDAEFGMYWNRDEGSRERAIRRFEMSREKSLRFLTMIHGHTRGGWTKFAVKYAPGRQTPLRAQ